MDVFIGHGLLVFALLAGGARLAGWERERALALGAVGGGFATAPDVDMAYALFGLAGAGVTIGDPLGVADAFWRSSAVAHRAVTHSLVLAAPVALAAGLWVRADRTGAPATRLAAVVLGGAVVAVTAVSGALAAGIAALFVAAAVAVAAATTRRTDLDAGTTTAAAAVGFVTHPFGDLLTGDPPAMLYPLDATLVAERIALSPDPTVHLLGAFGVELAAIWLGVGTFLAIRGYRIRRRVTPRATLGIGYAAVLPLIPAPSLDLSYPFVLSVLAVGALGLLPGLRVERPPGGLRGTTVDWSVPAVGGRDAATAALTGLAAVTVAWAAYGGAYLLAPLV